MSRRKPRQVVWTDRALDNLRAIGDFIARDNPAAAEKWVGTLMTAAESAAETPLAGRVVPEFKREDVRELLRRTYRIVYRVREQSLEVLTVFEGHRRFPQGVLPDTSSPDE